HRIDAQTQMDLPLPVSGSIVEMEVLGDRLLVAESSPPRSTRLRMYEISSLAPASDEKTIDGQVFAIRPLPPTSTHIPLVVFNGPASAPLDGSLALGRPFAPSAETPTAYLLLDQRTLALAYGPNYLEVDIRTNKSLLDLKLPESDIRALAFDPSKNSVIAGS